MNPSNNEKEMYLMLCGWTVETAACDNWWIPPKHSSVAKVYSMTRILDYAFRMQKAADEHRNIRQY